MARLYLPNTAQLVMVRGINDAPVFFDDKNYVQWQAIVRTIAPVHPIQIHAFALIENAVYLLLTAEGERSLGRFMQDLGRRYVRYVNALYGRSGTLWEGRYRTAYIQDTPHVMHAYRWLDSMSEHTSRIHHIGVQLQGFIQDHAQYWTLGNTPFDRQYAFKQLLNEGLPDRIVDSLQKAVQTGWALGDEHFLNQAARVGGRRVTPAARGRPRKSPVQD
ncbi:transposase [Hydromonas duriensis]|nr:transposase [Hydromonas duriensis]